VAYDDIHALKILDELGMILLPYTTTYYDDEDQRRTDNRLQIIDYSPNDLTARGWISQKGSVLRSQSFADRLFSISVNELQVIDAADRDTPNITASLTLANDFFDFVPLDNGYGVQVICKDSGVYTLRAAPLSDPSDGAPVSELTLDYTNSLSVIGNGNMVYVISENFGPYESESETNAVIPYYYTSSRIQVYDFTDVSNPYARGFMNIPGSYSAPKTLNGGASIYCSYYSTSDIIQLKDDVLVFNLTGSYYYPYYYGYYGYYPYYYPPYYWQGYDAFRGYLVVSLSDPDNPDLVSKVSIDIYNTKGLFAAGDVLYFSYSSSYAEDSQARPLVRYYLGRIDMSDPNNPIELNPVNVPGYCLGLSDSGDIAYTINNEWTQTHIYSYSQDYSFNVVKIQDDTAYLLDKMALDHRFYSAVIDNANGFAYLLESGWGGYGDSSEFNIIDISDPEALVMYEHSLAGRDARIFGVRNYKAFIGKYGGVACYDVTYPQSPLLEEFRSQDSWINRISFTSDKAYLPLGYYGLWVKNL
jgi:hypothetical protein